MQENQRVSEIRIDKFRFVGMNYTTSANRFLHKQNGGIIFASIAFGYPQANSWAIPNPEEDEIEKIGIAELK